MVAIGLLMTVMNTVMSYAFGLWGGFRWGWWCGSWRLWWSCSSRRRGLVEHISQT